MEKISGLEKSHSRKRGRLDNDVEVDRERFLERRRAKPSRQHDDLQDGQRLFACPFAKHNSSTAFRSCFLGWQSIARVKEHLSRRHKQWSSCYKKSTSACEVDGPWLSEEASRMLRCRSSDSPEAWIQIYCKIYPNATDVPSPFVDHHDHRLETRKHSIREFSQILCDGLDDVLQCSDRSSRVALDRRLRDYIQSQEHKYIDSQRDDDPVSSMADCPGPTPASSERSFDDLIGVGDMFHAPLSKIGDCNWQKSLMPPYNPTLEDYLGQSSLRHDWASSTEPYSFPSETSSKSVTTIRKRAQHAQLVSSWLDHYGVPPVASSSSSSTSTSTANQSLVATDMFDVVSSETLSPSSSIDTIPHVSEQPTAIDPYLISANIPCMQTLGDQVESTPMSLCPLMEANQAVRAPRMQQSAAIEQTTCGSGYAFADFYSMSADGKPSCSVARDLFPNLLSYAGGYYM